MRARTAALTAIVASATVFLTSSSALAEAGTCTLVAPTKVVVASEKVQTPVRLGEDCSTDAADHAYWDIGAGTATLGTLNFHPEDLADGVTTGDMVWFDVDPKGRYTHRAAGSATADGAALSQNSPVTRVKYASRLLSRAGRTRTGALTWAVTAQQWSGRAHGYVGRPKVRVGLFHRSTAGAPWRYVRSVTTTTAGKATVTMSAPKSGSYRLKVAETPTVWASYSSVVRGRI